LDIVYNFTVNFYSFHMYFFQILITKSKSFKIYVEKKMMLMIMMRRQRKA